MFEAYKDANASKVSLLDRLQNMAGQPFSQEEAFTILAQLGQALCYAHGCNVTHGNLKPDTILFNEKGDVLLADFFLHALANQPDDEAVAETSPYRAPELLLGHASKLGDQYALGYMAYEMLTGKKPFLIASIGRPDTFYRTKKPIPPKHFNPALSSLGEEAILKAIAKEPGQRHRDIGCFLTALGIRTEREDQATSLDADPLSLVPDPLGQADPPQQAPMWDAVEEVETAPTTLDTLIPTLTVHSTQTSVLAEPEDNASMEAFKLYTLADSVSYSPDHYPIARNPLAEAVATDSEVSMQTSVHAGPWSTNGAKLLIGAVIICLVVVCITAISFLALSVSHSAQERKTIPAIDTKIDLSSPRPTITLATSTPTPEATSTPEQRPTIAPSPTAGPTATGQALPTPTPRHRRH